MQKQYSELVKQLEKLEKNLFANYDKRIEEATGQLKTQLATEKEESLKTLQLQTEAL